MGCRPASLAPPGTLLLLVLDQQVLAAAAPLAVAAPAPAADGHLGAYEVEVAAGAGGRLWRAAHDQQVAGGRSGRVALLCRPPCHYIAGRKGIYRYIWYIRSIGII